MRQSTKVKILGQSEEMRDFHMIFSSILAERVQDLMAKPLNDATCLQFYTIIFDELVEILQTAGIKLCNEGANYIAQQYYDGILINQTQELNPNIFNKRASLDNIPTKELVLMAMMLKTTDFVWPVIEAIKKRN